MDKQDLSRFFKSIPIRISRHGPEILTGVGIAGMIGTTVMAVKATPKAIQLLEDKKKETGVEQLPVKEVVKATWKRYIPAAITGVASAACLIGACSINARRTAAIITAYNLSKTALEEYKEKVVETIGEEKEKAIREKVAKDRLDKNPVRDNEIIVTGNGDDLCYDGVFGRPFRSNKNAIERAVNAVNRKIASSVDMYASLNEFYEALGLPPTEIGDKLGWKLDDGEIQVEYDAILTDEGRPCLSISYNVTPKYDYSKYPF